MVLYSILGLSDWLSDITDSLDDYDLVEHVPQAFVAIVSVILFSVIVAVLASIIMAIANNVDNWKEKRNVNLYYGFWTGSGIYQSTYIFKETCHRVRDYRWWFFSFAGMAHSLGGISSSSKFLMFFASLIYIPLSALGFLEMMLRYTVGLIFVCVTFVLYVLFLFLMWGADLIVMPFVLYADRITRKPQHCICCYREFDLPLIECPNCETKHKDLSPGNTGLLWARCTCGIFLPCNALSGRSKMNAFCPKCSEELAAASYNPLTIQVIGGNNAGKTAYISAFQHVYLNSLSENTQSKTKLYHKYEFEDLEDQFQNGIPKKSSNDTVNAYSIVHATRWFNYDGVSIYDIPDEAINSDSYIHSPLNLGYVDGIVFIVDPLCKEAERKKSEMMDGAVSVEGYSDDDAEGLIVGFINIYSEITGRNSSRKTRIPIAVLIAKADLSVVDEKIGDTAIERTRQANNSIGKSIGEVRDALCRDYLLSIGLAGVVRHIESVFSNVAYFPISAIGHLPQSGIPFNPRGVVEPIRWLALKSGKMTNNLRDGLRGDTVDN